MADPQPRFSVFPIVAMVSTVATVAWWRDWLPLADWLHVAPTPVNLAGNYLVASVLHVDPLHLVFNLYWIRFFAPPLEQRFGTAWTWVLLGLLAFGTGGVELLLGSSGVGLSGLVYGLLTFAWAAERELPEDQRIARDRLVRFFAGWFVFCVATTELGIWRVGNVAHGAGATLGLLLGYAHTWPKPARWALWLAIPVASVLVWGPIR